MEAELHSEGVGGRGRSLKKGSSSKVGVAPGAGHAHGALRLVPPLVSAVVYRLDGHKSLLQVSQPLVRNVGFDLLFGPAVALQLLLEFLQLRLYIVEVVS